MKSTSKISSLSRNRSKTKYFYTKNLKNLIQKQLQVNLLGVVFLYFYFFSLEQFNISQSIKLMVNISFYFYFLWSLKYLSFISDS